jgi:sortase (surface protein transpeptidase)
MQKARYISSVCAVYGATLLFTLYLFHPFNVFAVRRPVLNDQASITNAPLVVAAKPKRTTVSGKPVRITIQESDNGLDIDLPILDGIYDENTASWSLSTYSAHYALLSVPANDTAGNTFVYGHSSKFVFGYLSAIHENVGAVAQIYTDNGHIFTYIYQTTAELEPSDTSVFNNSGPPMLVVQTCSGSFYEYRRMFYFKFEKVE